MKLAAMTLATLALIVLVASPIGVYGAKPIGVNSVTQAFSYNGSSVSSSTGTIGRHGETTVISPVNIGAITPMTAKVIINSSILEVGKDTRAITLSFVNANTTWACPSGCVFTGVNVTVQTSSGQTVACISAGTSICSIGATFRPSSNTNYDYYTLMFMGSSVPSDVALQITVSQD